MKKLLTIAASFLLFAGSAIANPIDSLKQQLQITTDDTQKATIYTQMAKIYLSGSTNPNVYTKRINQENAVNVTMQAMRIYYKQNDTTGLINSYVDLAKGYRSQNKFAQAKWFILQANTLSRVQNSTVNIVTTLVALAEIKMDIKDYNLAKRDLKEAHLLAVKGNFNEQDLQVKNSFSRLYNYLHVPENENVFTQSSKDLLADLRALDLLNTKRAVTIKPIIKSLAKKKMMTAALKHPYIQKTAMPALNWETPSNVMVADDVKTINL